MRVNLLKQVSPFFFIIRETLSSENSVNEDILKLLQKVKILLIFMIEYSSINYFEARFLKSEFLFLPRDLLSKKIVFF